MKIFASGKLLLFGEYLVLKGADCLAFPLKYGQTMTIDSIETEEFIWNSTVENKPWFFARFSKELQIIETSDDHKAEIIQKLLKFIQTENKALFKAGLKFETQTDFPSEWGFGTSSTLISLLSQWSGVNPYQLLEMTFGGSGYDIACATARTPILYNIKENKTKQIRIASEITDKLLFIYSGRKQNSAREIKQFDLLKITENQIEQMNKIVLKAAGTNQIEEFENLIEESEHLLSRILNVPELKTGAFKHYPFAMKSLGAWGGDFFMATFRDEIKARNYFNELGYIAQFTYQQLIK